MHRRSAAVIRIFNLVLAVSFAIVGISCESGGSTGRVSGTDEAASRSTWRDEIIAHQVSDTIEVGSQSPGLEVARIRFRVEEFYNHDVFTAVTLTAQSAQPGRIARLKTKLWGAGAWQTMLAVTDKDMRNLPPISLSLKDDFGNDYMLIAINPQTPHILEIYPDASVGLVAIFKGPLVGSAKSLRFQMTYAENGRKTHEWSFKR